MKPERRKLILFGAGGHCRSVIDSIVREQFSEIVILDKKASLIGTKIDGIPVVGIDDARTDLRKQGFDQAFITLGGTVSNSLRSRIASILVSEGFSFPIIRDPSAIISPSSCIAEGTFIAKGVIVNCGAKIGKHVILNSGCIIEHDCKIGDFCHIAPGACMSGSVAIGANSHVGTGASIRQSVTIGHNATIGVGSAVINDIPDHCVAYGVPCKVVKNG